MAALAMSSSFARLPSILPPDTAGTIQSADMLEPLPRCHTATQFERSKSIAIATFLEVPDLRRPTHTHTHRAKTLPPLQAIYLVVTQSEPIAIPPHPRAQYSTQELIEFYLLKLHNLWHSEPNVRERLTRAGSDFPNLDSSERDGDNRKPIPREKRNFYCMSREPAVFVYGAERKACQDSGKELTEAHLLKRWKLDYIPRGSKVEKWLADMEFALPERDGVPREPKPSSMRFRSLIAKVVGVRRRFGKKCRATLEGNALV